MNTHAEKIYKDSRDNIPDYFFCSNSWKFQSYNVSLWCETKINEIMNNEDYVSLEVAKLLKEKGFDYATLYYYEKNGKLGMMNLDAQSQMRKHGYMNDIYPRPTLYEAAKWLREIHNIHLDVRCTAYCKPLNRCDYVCDIFALSSNMFSDTKIYHKYEEALNAGILEALKLI